MKLYSTFAACMMAISTVLPLAASAASEAPIDPKAAKVDAKADAKAETKSQSSMDATPGMMHDGKEAASGKAASKKVKPEFDKTKHYHPRDGGKL